MALLDANYYYKVIKPGYSGPSIAQRAIVKIVDLHMRDAAKCTDHLCFQHLSTVTVTPLQRRLSKKPHAREKKVFIPLFVKGLEKRCIVSTEPGGGSDL